MSSNLKLYFIALLINFFAIPAFSQYPFTSNLPIVYINTNGQQIIDEPKITANMGIIWNGPGKRNAETDPLNNYNGTVGIEIRGSSSQMFPKKSYGFETRSNDGLSVNVSLLGMPEENTDKTMIRDVLTYTLYASFGHYTPRCRFVELFLNSQYQGVYVLMEKIKRDKNRVDIAKLKLTDNTGENLTGGYIIKIDKTTGSDRDGWNSIYSNTSGKTLYLYDYPDFTEITASQKTYIQNFVKTMETSLYQNKYSGIGSYHDYLNDSTFIDFMIINELAKNVDGYRLSSYLYKGKSALINCGPIWDFNLGYGNANYYSGWTTYGFQYEANLTSTSGQPDYSQIPFWWDKLVRDPIYEKKLRRRWALLRKNKLSNQRINFVTDSLVSLISDAQYRNYLKWPILGQYVWPNYYVGFNYNSEVSWMKNWISERLIYLDNMWPYDFTGSENQMASQAISIFPNPFSDRISIQLNSNENDNGVAEVFSSSGMLVWKSNIVIQNGQIHLIFSGSNSLKPGLYVLKVTCNNRILLTEKVVKGQ